MMIIASSILEVRAQSYVTYNHDEAKMNQITVQEIGAGGLTPAFYYDVFHRSYQRSAGSKNKLTYRSLAGVAGWQQVDDADSVKAITSSSVPLKPHKMPICPMLSERKNT